MSCGIVLPPYPFGSRQYAVGTGVHALSKNARAAAVAGGPANASFAMCCEKSLIAVERSAIRTRPGTQTREQLAYVSWPHQVTWGEIAVQNAASCSQPRSDALYGPKFRIDCPTPTMKTAPAEGVEPGGPV